MKYARSERGSSLAHRARQEGVRPVAAAAARAVAARAARAARVAWWRASFPVRRRLPQPEFELDGASHRVFVHPYNATWRNERAVEVPVVLAALAERPGRALEVGNVLGHYVDHSHEVVDKFEVAPGIRNVDLLDHRPPELYDLIVSISTFEHVGFDDDVQDPQKFARAVDHVRKLLRPGGRAVITLPLGYNPHLDERLRAGTDGFDRRLGLRRTGRTLWVQAPVEELPGTRYGSPYPGANALVIGILDG